jgi:hypothetical protein
VTKDEIHQVVQEMFPQFVPHLLSEKRVHALANICKKADRGSREWDRAVIHLLQQSTLAEALAAMERGESTDYLKDYLADYKKRGVV